MNLALLTTFLAVAESGGFTKAAREMFLTQPAISQHIHALEEKLGVTLFIRRGQKIQLTCEGEELRRHARAIMKAVEEAEFSLKEMSVLKRGRLRIGATMYMAYLLPPVLVEFKRHYPLVQVDVRFHNSAKVIQLVEDGSVDIGFAGGMINKSSRLSVTPVHAERLALVAPPDHPLAGSQLVKPADLHPHMLAVRERGTYTRRRVMDWFAHESLPENLIEVSRIEAALQLALNGCLTFVPEGTISREISTGRLVSLPTEGLTSDMEYNLYFIGTTIPGVTSYVFLKLLAKLPVLSAITALKELLEREAVERNETYLH